MSLPAGNLGAQRIQSLRPEAAEMLEPLVDGVQRLGVDRVDAPPTIGAHGGEPMLPQHLKVLRDGGLADAELCADQGDEVTGWSLAIGEQFK